MYKIILLALISAVMISCESGSRRDLSDITEPPDLNETIASISETVDDLDIAIENLEESEQSIDGYVDQIEAKVPIESQPEVDGIRAELKELRELSSLLTVYRERLVYSELELGKQQDRIERWTKYAKDREEEVAGLKEQIENLRDKNAQSLKEKLAWVIVSSTAGIGLMIVIAFWTRSKFAIMIAIGLGVVIAISLALTLYMKVIALVTMSVMVAAILAGLIYLVYHLRQENKTNDELVQTTEILKQHIPLEDREELFGHGASPGKIDLVQSKSTKNRVKDIRNGRKREFDLAPKILQYYRPPLRTDYGEDPSDE